MPRAHSQFVFALGLSALIAGLIAPRLSAAQEDLGAEEVTRLVQAFYDQTRVFEAEFEQTQYTRIYDRTEQARGKVVFKKPGKMRFDYAGKNAQVFVSDGKELKI